MEEACPRAGSQPHADARCREGALHENPVRRTLQLWETRAGDFTDGD